jgi:hypothetical protein
MPKVMTKERRVLGLLFAGLLFVTFVVDVAAEETGGDEWQFIGEVYMWGASLGGTTGAGDDIDIPFSDILEHLNFGAMGAAAAKKGKWTLFADAFYLDLETDDNSTANIIGRPIKTSVDVEVKGFISTAGASYDVFENDSTRVALLAGGRYLWLDVELEFDVGAVTEKASDSGSVIDGIIGFRGRTKIADRWHIIYYADVGTGESDLTWQALGSLNYRFMNVDLVLGYRYLDWNFDSDDGDVLDDLNLHGPFAGVKFSF